MRYQANREATIVRACEYQRTNPLVNDLARQRYRDKNREQRRAKSRARWEAHPEKWRLYASTRRARKRGASIGVIDYDAILAAHGMICHLCGGEIEDGDLHYDHVIPLAKGGEHSNENIRPSHAFCNRSKGARLM